MADQRNTIPPHRTNYDGSFDSICPICFATIANSRIESELTACEKSHTCDQSFLADRGVLTNMVNLIQHSRAL
jgi:hypothetical protein